MAIELPGATALKAATTKKFVNFLEQQLEQHALTRQWHAGIVGGHVEAFESRLAGVSF